mgnify:CR=1 FL=1
MRKSLLALLLVAAGGLAQAGLVQAEVQLKDGHPDRYTVVKGDTLWDISGKFLSLPWKWPELWHANPQIENPHLIYPGDTLSLVYIDGQPRLMLNRGASRGTIKLSPKVRSTPMAEAIPTIPLEAINSFLLSNRIVNSAEEFAAQPYIVAGRQESVIAGAGDRIYGRGACDMKGFVACAVVALLAAARARGFSPADDNEADAIAILLWAIETNGGVA